MVQRASGQQPSRRQPVVNSAAMHNARIVLHQKHVLVTTTGDQFVSSTQQDAARRATMEKLLENAKAALASHQPQAALLSVKRALPLARTREDALKIVDTQVLPQRSFPLAMSLSTTPAQMIELAQKAAAMPLIPIAGEAFNKAAQMSNNRQEVIGIIAQAAAYHQPMYLQYPCQRLMELSRNSEEAQDAAKIIAQYK